MKTYSDKTITVENNESLSYNDLFNEMYSALCMFAGRFLVVASDGEDLVQEVFVKLWDKFEEFNSLNAVKAYLYQATRNACLNEIRHEKVKRKYESHQVKQVESESYYLKQVVEEETSRIIANSIDELPPQCKKILQLSMQGLKNQEIADDLGISVNSVKTQKAIAYKTLRSKLQNIFDLILHILWM
ncbi:RNA polymerase sigma-70 factor [Marinifilum caeruleilacunae]|uniref:RNA polymerase sigma-70 factor n=1 Tax=Marinifilum caeruleilacunae TaxID=2499076 RepID=A0ABX1WTA5_9BACT|nr:RNA polymerase sigma-70 factor [Marinifilum caeruleilacunae]NOU59322.1 RNA polymerase sigma-70 factor [Marinifilum caeruleilacunae]